MSEETKTCTKCGEVKPIIEYEMRTDSIDGRRHQCKICHGTNVKAWDVLHRRKSKRVPVTAIAKKERKKEWRKENAERLSFKRFKWGLLNKEKVKKYGRAAAENMTDRYLRNLIAGKDRVMYVSVPSELIVAKREQLQILRLAKEFKQTMKEVFK